MSRSQQKPRVLILNHVFHVWFMTLPMASGMKTLQDSSKDAKDKKHHESKDVKESKDEKSSSPHFPSMKLGRESSMWSWAFLQPCLSEMSWQNIGYIISCLFTHFHFGTLLFTIRNSKVHSIFRTCKMWRNSQHPNIAIAGPFFDLTLDKIHQSHW